MEVFRHHLYEYWKGLRSLILHTASAADQFQIEKLLRSRQVAYEIVPLGNGHVNVFFGNEDCVALIRAIGKASLKDYTDEEDFILGTMLGYDRLQQCRRYLDRRRRRHQRSIAV